MDEMWRPSEARQSKLPGGRFRLDLLLAVFAFWFSGCLPSNPDSDSGNETDSVSYQPTVQPPTRAPLEIDPAIIRDRSFGEAPMLAERVRAGELPPVSERLPEKPLMVVPMEKIGKYGGSIRRALTTDVIEADGVLKTLSESLMGFERPLPNSIEVNLAERFEILDDGRVVLFHIRKGIKWSDGVPFTVDDILFWYHDVIFDDNARADPLFPSTWLVDGKSIEMEKVDAHTLRVSSHKPLGRILHAFSSDEFALPKHVYAQYHPRYNVDATYADFRDRTSKANRIFVPGIPRLTAWIPKQWVRNQRIVFERNPYYWKIDTAGNQLPYADQLVFSIIGKIELIQIKFLNGELDIMGRYGVPGMEQLLAGSEQREKTEVRITGPGRGLCFYINFDTPKVWLREAFRNREVRIALSRALDREDICRTINPNGLMQPCGYSFSPFSPYYSREAYMRYTEYDPDEACRLLDEAGYRDNDGDGYRDLKDGSRFEFTIDAQTIPGQSDACEFVAEYWEQIGIKVNLNIALEDLIYPRRLNGEFDLLLWGLEAPADPLGRPNAWAIMTPQTPFWHRNASTEGPSWLKEATENVKLAMSTLDPETLRAYMIRVRDLHTENVPVIVVGSAYRVWGVNKRLGNVPYVNTSADVFRGWARPVFHEQIYIK